MRGNEFNEICNRFNYHRPTTDDVVKAHEVVRESLKTVTTELLPYVPEGREQAMFITKMEEAMYWANAAIARNQ